MKATINYLGRLSVIPEDELEAYALKAWWQNYLSGDRSDKMDASSLCVEHDMPIPIKDTDE